MATAQAYQGRRTQFERLDELQRKVRDIDDEMRRTCKDGNETKMQCLAEIERLQLRLQLVPQKKRIADEKLGDARNALSNKDFEKALTLAQEAASMYDDISDPLGMQQAAQVQSKVWTLLG